MVTCLLLLREEAQAGAGKSRAAALTTPCDAGDSTSWRLAQARPDQRLLYGTNKCGKVRYGDLVSSAEPLSMAHGQMPWRTDLIQLFNRIRGKLEGHQKTGGIPCSPITALQSSLSSVPSSCC